MTSLLDAVLVVGVVGVARAEEVELGVVDLVLLDPLLELGAVPRHEARGLVHDVPDLGRRVDDADGGRRQRQLLRGRLQRDRRHLGLLLRCTSALAKLNGCYHSWKDGNMVITMKFSKYIFFAVGFLYNSLCAMYYKGLRRVVMLF